MARERNLYYPLIAATSVKTAYTHDDPYSHCGRAIKNAYGFPSCLTKNF